MSVTTTPPAERLEDYTLPVLYTSAGDRGIWHVPKVENGQVEYLCDSHRESNRILISEKSAYQRRRNPRMCKMCQKHAGVDAYPDKAPFDGEQ